MKINLISVVMSVYNEKPKWLSEAIESILNQTYKNIEFIIIMDNPSNLVLIDTIKSYQELDDRIKFYLNKKNMGLIYSLNRGLKYCNGDFIARMDADDISHKNRFKKQFNYLVENNLDLIGSNINLFKNENDIFFTTDKLTTHKYLEKILENGTIGIVHPTFFGRKDVFKKLNGYANSLHTEDKEFLARVFCNGFRVGNIKEVLLDCRYNDKSVTKTNSYVMNRNAMYIVKIFKEYLKNGKYNFDEYYHSKLKITQKEKDNFNKKQILMGEVRKELNDKNYFKFMYNILKAIFYSKSVFLSIKINIIFKLFKFMENIELRDNK